MTYLLHQDRPYDCKLNLLVPETKLAQIQNSSELIYCNVLAVCLCLQIRQQLFANVSGDCKVIPVQSPCN